MEKISRLIDAPIATMVNVRLLLLATKITNGKIANTTKKAAIIAVIIRKMSLKMVHQLRLIPKRKKENGKKTKKRDHMVNLTNKPISCITQ